MLVYTGCETSLILHHDFTNSTFLSSASCIAVVIGPVAGDSLATCGEWHWLFCEWNGPIEGLRVLRQCVRP